MDTHAAGTTGEWNTSSLFVGPLHATRAERPPLRLQMTIALDMDPVLPAMVKTAAGRERELSSPPSYHHELAVDNPVAKIPGRTGKSAPCGTRPRRAATPPPTSARRADCRRKTPAPVPSPALCCLWNGERTRMDKGEHRFSQQSTSRYRRERLHRGRRCKVPELTQSYPLASIN